MGLRQILRNIRRRYWQLRLRLKNVHPTFLVGGKSQISRDFRAGAYSYVGPECNIGPGVELGKYSMIGPRVQILGNDHVFDRPGTPVIFSGRPAFRTTAIGDDVWLGASVIVIAGLSIADGIIVAAGSVVTKDLDVMGIYAGVPARLIRRRFDNDEELIHREYLKTPPREGKFAATMTASH